MTNGKIRGLSLTKHPSGTYELEWESMDNVRLAWERKSCFYTKAQLMKLANKRTTYEEVREFLKNHLRSGEVIK